MKNGQSGPLSAAQFEIMCCVWQKGEATVNEVLETVNEGRKKKLRRTTIQVQMTRLESKGWLTHTAKGRTFVYKAVKDRNEAEAFIAGDVTKRIFGGSCADLVKCLFTNNKISKQEISRIRKILDQEKGG